MITGKQFSKILYPLIFALSFGAALAQAYFFINPIEHIYSDMGGYIERAWELSLGITPDNFSVFFPPGVRYIYGVVFWIFGFSLGLHALIILQALSISGSTLLVGKISKRLFGNQRLALFLMLLSLLYWPFTAQVSFFMAEPLFSFLILLGVYFYLSALLNIAALGRALSTLSLLAASGLAVGTSVLIKGQGLAILISILLAHFFLSVASWRLRSILLFLVFALSPIALQFSFNSTLLQKPSFFLSSNDAYNSYLGQSRKKAVGCSDTKAGYFYIFHNNNSGLDYPFFEAAMIETPIMDREAFREKTLELWKQDPLLQLTISFHNVIELFEVNPRWPLRNITAAGKLDAYFQWGFLFFTLVPLGYSVMRAITQGKYRAQLVILCLPLLGISGVVFFTMGQPRYLLPFQYFFLLASAPFYLDLFTGGAKAQVETRVPRYAIRLGHLSLVVALLAYSSLSFLFYRSLGIVPLEEKGDTYELALPSGNILQNLSTIDPSTSAFTRLSGDTEVNIQVDSAHINSGRKIAEITERSRLTIRVPQTAVRPNSIGFYLSEASGRSTAWIEYRGKKQMLSELQSGAWVFFPIPELVSGTENHRGVYDFRIRKLTGPPIGLHSVITLRKDEGNV